MPAAAIVARSEGGAAAAAATAVDTAYWQHRRRWSRRKVASWGIALALVGAVSWLIASDRAMASQVKSFITTAHSETITDGSIAIKPHGFASYKVTVPAGAIDVGLMGQFEASGRGSNEVEVLLLTESELAVWQSGYATSPYFDSGTVAKAEIEAVLPSNAGEYYLVLSNKAGRVEKTVHVAAGLRYDTWLPDSLVDLKQKIVSWFE